MAEADPAFNRPAPALAPTMERPEAKAMTSAEPAPAPMDIEEEEAPRSKRLRRILMFSVPVLLLAAGAYAWATSGQSVSTDNAYVKQNVVSVSSDVGGRIVDVRVHENQMVKAGDILFVVDPQPYRVALAQANAQIASAQVEVGKLSTDVSATTVDMASARQNVVYARQDLERQQALMKDGFTTKARLQQAENAYAVAQISVSEAQASAAKARAASATGSQVPGVNPQLAAAQAAHDKAALDLTRTVVRAPVSGRVSQVSRLQVGQMMVTGLPALSIVAENESWIEANFKETDLNHMHPGQVVKIGLDAYPDIEMKGHVESIGAGTGSQFSVLPAQNATGNWVKVTQRVPVRIAIDDKASRQLIAGLTADVTVDIRGKKTDR